MHEGFRTILGANIAIFAVLLGVLMKVWRLTSDIQIMLLQHDLMWVHYVREHPDMSYVGKNRTLRRAAPINES